MLAFIVIVAVGGIALLVMKRPLSLGPGMKAGGMPVACPTCRSFLAETPRDGQIVRCDCGAYTRMENGALAAIAADYVAPNHAFTAFLPEAPSWPACCAVCCGPATRGEKLALTYAAEPTFEEKLTAQAAVGIASLGTVSVVKHQVNVTERYTVPHCDQHANGAQVTPNGVAFRSYDYFTKFVAANRAPVGGS